MKRFRKLFVCLLSVSLLSTTLVTQFQASASGNNESAGSLARQGSNSPLLRLRQSGRFEGVLLSSSLFNALTQREQERTPQRIPPFMVWSSLSQRDVESLLPRGAIVQVQRDGGYLVSGVTDAIEFGLNLGAKSTERRADDPRIGKQGTSDPKTISPRIRAIANKIGQVLHDILYGPKNPGKRELFPQGPIPEPETVQEGFDPTKDPPVTGGGKWVYFCEPAAPCVRPTEPNPEDVDDCKREQAEVDYLASKLNEFSNWIETTEDALTGLDELEAIADTAEGIWLTLAIYAALTCPIGAAAGIVIVAGPLTVGKILKGIFDVAKIAAARLLLQKQLADFKRIYNSYLKGYNDALAELRACRQKAAEAAGRNTAAFQKFINVDLPAYYDCLKQRKCRRRWVPK